MNQSIKQTLKQIIPRRLWNWLRIKARSSTDRRYWWLCGIPANRRSDRKSLYQFDIQEGCFIETFWVDQLSRGGISEFGPAAIIVIHGSEILKFDCYGDLNAHYHIATPYPRGIRNGFHGRLWWQEKTVKEQLDRTVFELIYNLKSYLATHPRRKVRNTIIDSERLASVCHQLKMRMLQDEERYGCVRRDSIEVV